MNRKKPPTGPAVAIRILLSTTASKYLDTIDGDCFVVASYDRSDARSGHWRSSCMHDRNQTNTALRVTQGISKERRIRSD